MRWRRRAAGFTAFGATLLVAGVLAVEGGPPEAPAPPPPSPAPLAPPPADWLDDPGTAVLGFGLLRVSPAAKGTQGVVRLRYEERPADYGAFDSVQLTVLPGDVFASDGRAFADQARAFDRSKPGTFSARASVDVTAPAVLIVGFGPFRGPDTGRPLTLDRAYSLEVTAEGASWRWVDAEAGELNVKGWTNRPMVRRGGPVVDPVTSCPHWFEVRPQIVYDRDRVRAPGDPETPEAAPLVAEADSLTERAKALEAAGKADAGAEMRAEADEVRARAANADDRLLLPAALAARFRRLPFRWK